jgi:hypothetical protein
MQIHVDHAQFVQALVLRITSTPEFNATDAEITKACDHAFAVGRKFFAAYDAEVEELKAIDESGGRKKIEAKKANGGTTEKKPVAEKRAVKKASKA